MRATKPGRSNASSPAGGNGVSEGQREPTENIPPVRASNVDGRGWREPEGGSLSVGSWGSLRVAWRAREGPRISESHRVHC